MPPKVIPTIPPALNELLLLAESSVLEGLQDTSTPININFK